MYFLQNGYEVVVEIQSAENFVHKKDARRPRANKLQRC